jgi:hypothetical protein
MKWAIYMAGKKAAREQMANIKRQVECALQGKEGCNPYRLVQLDCYTPQICLEK